MSDAQQIAKEYLALEEQIKRLEAVRDEKKKALRDLAQATGETTEDGHVVLTLDTPVSGIKGFQLQRRVTRALDEETAETILTLREVRDKCFRTVEVLDQDEVFNCVRLGELNEAEADKIFPPKISYAFTKVKE